MSDYFTTSPGRGFFSQIADRVRGAVPSYFSQADISDAMSPVVGLPMLFLQAQDALRQDAKTIGKGAKQGIDALGRAQDATYAEGYTNPDVYRPVTEAVLSQIGGGGTIPAVGRMARGMKVGDPSTLGAGMVVRPYATTKMAPDAPAELDAGLVVKAPKNYERKKTVTPEDFPVGGYFTQLYGDRSNVGDLIETASGRLDSPLELQGGQGFLRNKATGIWASHPGPMTGISNRVKVASEKGKPVYGVFSPMSGQSTDFAKMTTDLMLDKLGKSEPTKAAIKKFDKEMKAKHDDFPGVMSEKLDDWLAETGNHRYDLSKVMAKGEYTKAGFPDFAEIRHAIQDPELRDLEFGMSPLSGQSIGKLDEAGTLQPSIHKTYPVEMPGEYVGGFDVPVPRGMIFRDWFDARRRDNPGATAAHEGKSFMGSHIMQPIDQQLIDTLMTYRNKRLTE